jgi:hypothetical protein
MAAIVLAPMPMNSGLGVGFWVELKERLAAAVSTMEENTTAATSPSSSSDDSDDAGFDPTINTVAEFQQAIVDIIDSLIGGVDDDSSD